jgi:hypothetical protein
LELGFGLPGVDTRVLLGTCLASALQASALKGSQFVGKILQPDAEIVELMTVVNCP